jgi:hypothetical protein
MKMRIMTSRKIHPPGSGPETIPGSMLQKSFSPTRINAKTDTVQGLFTPNNHKSDPKLAPKKKKLITERNKGDG